MLSVVRIFSLLPSFACLVGFSVFHVFVPQHFSLFITSLLRLFGWFVVSFFVISFLLSSNLFSYLTSLLISRVRYFISLYRFFVAFFLSHFLFYSFVSWLCLCNLSSSSSFLTYLLFTCNEVSHSILNGVFYGVNFCIAVPDRHGGIPKLHIN